MPDPLYYAEGRTVFKRPVSQQKADGSTTTSLGFPVCEASEWVGDEGASAIAALLTAGETALREGQSDEG